MSTSKKCNQVAKQIFKNKNTNTWRTRTMFVNIVRKSKSMNQQKYVDFDENECMYWLSEVEDESVKLPVLREKFLELRDATGMELAKKYLGGWPHLQTLLKCPWFITEWNKWQEELFIEIQAESLKKISEISQGEGAIALSAAKYLANKEWDKSPANSKRGRPSQEEVDGALKHEVQKASEARKDYERMTLIQGGRA